MKGLSQASENTHVPQETGALIDHILTRYHEMHRDDLASLMPLADRVERVHADDPDAPTGLARAVRMLAPEMEDHMIKEEMILFPAMRAGGGLGIEHPIAVMRADHDDHAESIALIRQLTHDLTPPDHACGSWRSLYGGLGRVRNCLHGFPREPCSTGAPAAASLAGSAIGPARLYLRIFGAVTGRSGLAGRSGGTRLSCRSGDGRPGTRMSCCP